MGWLIYQPAGKVGQSLGLLVQFREIYWLPNENVEENSQKSD